MIRTHDDEHDNDGSMSVMHFANALVWEIIGPAMAGPSGPCATPLLYDKIVTRWWQIAIFMPASIWRPR